MNVTQSNNCACGIPYIQRRYMEVMANDVAKNIENEEDFETYVKNKRDPRFAYLYPQHAFHWYYLECKERSKAEHIAIAAIRNVSRCSNTGSRRIQDENQVSSVAGPGHTSASTSATGIPIANDASVQSPPTTVSAEQDPHTEEIRETNTDLSNACDKLASAFGVVIGTIQKILESRTNSKDKAVVKLSSSISVEVVKKEAIEISQSDVESVPSPSHVQLDSEETCEENEAAISTGSSSSGHLLPNELENEVQDRLLSENQDRQNGTIGSSHEKKTTGKRSLSCSSIESSDTDTRTSSSFTPSKKRSSE